MLTEKNFVETTKDLIQNNYDFIYKKDCNQSICYYIPNTTNEGCLFGQVLAKLGVNINDLNGPIDNILKNLNIGFSEQTIKWASFIQIAQDNGVRWGICLLLANEADITSGVL